MGNGHVQFYLSTAELYQENERAPPAEPSLRYAAIGFDFGKCIGNLSAFWSAFAISGQTTNRPKHDILRLTSKQLLWRKVELRSYSFFSAACAAASRAMGTRKGEQET